MTQAEMCPHVFKIFFRRGGWMKKMTQRFNFVPIFKVLTFMGNDMLSMAQDAKLLDVEPRFL